MRSRQTNADLVRGFQSLVRWKAADAAQQGRKILAVDVLHGKKVLAVDLANVVDTTDIRVRNLTGVAYLGVKPCKRRGIMLDRSGKKLQGYNNAELKILSAVDFAHAATSQKSDDPIPLDENSAWRKSAVSLARGRA